MTSIVEIEGLTKLYANRYALRDIDLKIPSGVTGLLGPNGSGKSTLIKSLLGLTKIQFGRVSVLGFELPHRLREVRDHVGYLPEDDCYLAGLTGIESIHAMAKLSGMHSIEGLRRSHEILDFSDIGSERYRNVETYSTGMRQKLKFAQALVHDPELLILDEPTTGLDPLQRVGMLRRIQSLAKRAGKSVLLSTHILHDVKEVCDQVVILSKGQIRVVDRLENLSQPTEPGIQIKVAERADELVRELNLRGCNAAIREQGTIWAIGDFQADCSEIWRAASSSRVTIMGMSPATHSLEQIFFDAVKEADHASS